MPDWRKQCLFRVLAISLTVLVLPFHSLLAEHRETDSPPSPPVLTASPPAVFSFSPPQVRAFPSAGPSEQKFFKELLGDFKRVFTTKENLLIVGTGLGAAWAVSPWDQDIARSRFNSELFGESRLDTVFESGAVVGGGIVQVGGAALTYGLGKLLSNPDAEDLGSDLLRAQILAQSFTLGIKVATGRERPDHNGNRSFPSGHTSSTFATATVLQRHYGWKAGVPAYALGAYIAGSRLSEGKHYLSDVVFGAAIGIMAGRSISPHISKGNLQITPVPLAGGAAVQVWLLPGRN